MIRAVIRGITGTVLAFCVLVSVLLVHTMAFGTEWAPLGASHIMILLVLPAFFIAGLIHLLAGPSGQGPTQPTEGNAAEEEGSGEQNELAQEAHDAEGSESHR